MAMPHDTAGAFDAARAAPARMRAAFSCGRKSTMRPRALRCAFMPSNTLWP